MADYLVLCASGMIHKVISNQIGVVVLNHKKNLGPAVMAVWSKALSLTASCLPPMYGFIFCLRLVRKLPVTCG